MGDIEDDSFTSGDPLVIRIIGFGILPSLMLGSKKEPLYFLVDEDVPLPYFDVGVVFSGFLETLQKTSLPMTAINH